MTRPTVADLVAFAQVPDREADDLEDELAQHLAAAVAYVEGRCGPMVDGTRRVQMRHPYRLVMPFGRLDTVSVVDSTGAEVEVEDEFTDYEAGVLHVYASRLGRYTVTFTREPEGLESLRLATVMIAAHLWDTRRGSVGNSGDYGAPEAMYAPGYGFAVPRRAADIMAPFTTPVVA